MDAQPLSTSQDPIPVGAHLVTPRKAYSHHGIYVGGGRVVHYAGGWRLGRRGPVEMVSLEAFTRGHGYRIERGVLACFSAAEIARRALARIGENRYSVVHNNCEHFCLWCITGVARSAQVERLLAWRALGFAMRVIARTPAGAAAIEPPPGIWA